MSDPAQAKTAQTSKVLHQNSQKDLVDPVLQTSSQLITMSLLMTQMVQPLKTQKTLIVPVLMHGSIWKPCSAKGPAGAHWSHKYTQQGFVKSSLRLLFFQQKNQKQANFLILCCVHVFACCSNPRGQNTWWRSSNACLWELQQVYYCNRHNPRWISFSFLLFFDLFDLFIRLKQIKNQTPNKQTKKTRSATNKNKKYQQQNRWKVMLGHSKANWQHFQDWLMTSSQAVSKQSTTLLNQDRQLNSWMLSEVWWKRFVFFFFCFVLFCVGKKNKCDLKIKCWWHGKQKTKLSVFWSK